MRHKARLSAELKRACLRRKCATIEDLRRHLARQREDAPTFGQSSTNTAEITSRKPGSSWPHPRWVRVNTLRSSLDEQLDTTFAEYQHVTSLEEVLSASKNSSVTRRLYIDETIPYLIALPPSTNVSTLPAYQNGLIILQDKASCFPAYLLDPRPEDGDCLDACAAPGNKTTHLAAIMQEKSSPNPPPRIWACERDKARAMTLQSMIRIAGADQLVSLKDPGRSFSKLNPEAPPMDGVGSLLLDPSCSGSGILGRDDISSIVLPSKEVSQETKGSVKKWKRRGVCSSPLHPINPEQEVSTVTLDSETLQERLTALSNVQLDLLLHTFQFPQARRIVYSTCSVHVEENEMVVLKALRSDTALERGWRLIPREHQKSGMRGWGVRGQVAMSWRGDGGDNSELAREVADCCIRCEKGTNAGTQGFFVAAFWREGSEEKPDRDYIVADTEIDTLEGDSEWEGFSEAEDPSLDDHLDSCEPVP